MGNINKTCGNIWVENIPKMIVFLPLMLKRLSPYTPNTEKTGDCSDTVIAILKEFKKYSG
jgi:hypothetical protein